MVGAVVGEQGIAHKQSQQQVLQWKFRQVHSLQTILHPKQKHGIKHGVDSPLQQQSSFRQHSTVCQVQEILNMI